MQKITSMLNVLVSVAVSVLVLALAPVAQAVTITDDVESAAAYTISSKAALDTRVNPTAPAPVVGPNVVGISSSIHGHPSGSITYSDGFGDDHLIKAGTYVFTMYVGDTGAEGGFTTFTTRLQTTVGANELSEPVLNTAFVAPAANTWTNTTVTYTVSATNAHIGQAFTWAADYRRANKSDAIFDAVSIEFTPSPPTSSGIDLRAYTTAEGVMVEFIAYDVEQDGTTQLDLLGENDAVVWSGTVDVTAGPQFIARFQVPGLELGGSYSFRVRDEVGNYWDASNVAVGNFSAKMFSATISGITLSFGSLPQREYDIQWCAKLGGEWQTVASVTATADETLVVVPTPEGAHASAFFRIQAK